MIVVEVETGFRVARGGVRESMEARADLRTFAKAVANGTPISVLAGRGEIMPKIGDGAAHDGTTTAHPVSPAAAEKTLDIPRETGPTETLAAFEEGIGRTTEARGRARPGLDHVSRAAGGAA